MHKKSAETEASIKAAFVDLLQTKTFEKISVRDLSVRAGINRGTFYLHYVDKYDLLTQYEDRLVATITKLLATNLTGTMTYQSVKTNGIYTYPVVENVVSLVANEFDLFKVLFGPNGDPRFELRLKRLLRDAIGDGLDRIKGQITMTKYIPEDYAWELILSGLFAIIKTWLQSPTPEEPATICTIIMNTRFLSPYDLLGIRE
ncbi:TetR/AcrR family transcriptional regulator [Lacticaseibacillus parakribbianus]|uniref:TetR/AcrR family transcriptional regulator n=1 Tax=Lacticaseibacillus parakribbianus TaxID=2970927 RepID=UPI0021CAFB92|nr:TetR/AcrR family transcriptional regulator [Lacticaseibacillus parakribbianus]